MKLSLYLKTVAKKLTFLRGGVEGYLTPARPQESKYPVTENHLHLS